jgi:hypothetical protein
MRVKIGISPAKSNNYRDRDTKILKVGNFCIQYEIQTFYTNVYSVNLYHYKCYPKSYRPENRLLCENNSPGIFLCCS